MIGNFLIFLNTLSGIYDSHISFQPDNPDLLKLLLLYKEVSHMLSLSYVLKLVFTLPTVFYSQISFLVAEPVIDHAISQNG